MYVPGIAHGMVPPGPLELSFKSVTNSQGSSLTLPPLASGDVAVLMDFAYNINSTTLPAETIPEGFTPLLSTFLQYSFQDAFGNLTPYRARMVTAVRVCTGSETGSLTGLSGSFACKTLLVFNASRRVSSFTNVRSSTPTASLSASLTPDDVTPHLVIGYSPRNSSWGRNPEFDQTGSFGVSNGTTFWGYSLYNRGRTPLAQTITPFTSNSSHSWINWLIAFRLT